MTHTPDARPVSEARLAELISLADATDAFDEKGHRDKADCISALRELQSLRAEVERLEMALRSAKDTLCRIHEEAQNCDDEDALDALDYIIGWSQDADDAARAALSPQAEKLEKEGG